MLSAVLLHTADDYGYEAELLKATVSVNKHQRLIALEKLQKELKILKGKTIGLLGLTFKPDTDDMRDAPSLTIVPAMVGGGANVTVVDPHGKHEGVELLPSVEWSEDLYSAAEGCDLVVLLTEWNEFRALDLGRIASAMSKPRLADLRNVYSAQDAKAAGFERYVSVGRQSLGDPE